MPEGHKIHRLAKDLNQRFKSTRIDAESPQGRFSKGATLIDSSVVTSAQAWGKHLTIQTSKDLFVHIHLGLYGRFKFSSAPGAEAGETVRLRLRNNHSVFDLTGPSCCELLELKELQELHERLGPDPIRPSASYEEVWRTIRNSKVPIGKILLEQRKISGVGNIYRAEALFATQINPNRQAKDLEELEFERLWDWLVTYMRLGVSSNRIITNAELTKEMMVYGQEKCPRCQRRIEKWDLGGRKMFACPNCQK